MNAMLAQLIAAARRRPLVAASLALTLILGAANYFLWQQRTLITLENDKVRQRGEDILDALIARQHITSDLAKLQDALDTIDRNLVVEADMELNLGYFYKLEKRCGVHLSQLNQLSALPPPEGNPFKIVPVSLRANGSYVQLMNFLHQLETGPRILTVRAFNFSRSDPNSKSPVLSLDLTVDLLSSQ